MLLCLYFTFCVFAASVYWHYFNWKYRFFLHVQQLWNYQPCGHFSIPLKIHPHGNAACHCHIEDTQQCIQALFLSHKALRKQFQACQPGRDQILSYFQKPPRSVPEPWGKGENYVIALSHEWFNSSHWLRFLSLQYLQTTWGTNEDSLQPVIKMCANAATFETYSVCFVLMSSHT